MRYTQCQRIIAILTSTIIISLGWATPASCEDALRAAPLNLDFEDAVGADGIPSGWRYSNGRGQTLSIDKTVFHSGKQSLRVKKESDISLGDLVQSIDAVPYRGKRVKFSTWIKTQDSIGGFGHWIAVIGPDGFLGSDHASYDKARDVSGNSDWTERSVEIDVPKEAVKINLGYNSIGSGVSWVDGGRFEALP